MPNKLYCKSNLDIMIIYYINSATLLPYKERLFFEIDFLINHIFIKLVFD